MWLRAVFGVITSSVAICLFDRPRASRTRTSPSRAVRPATPSRRRGTRWPAGLTTREVDVLRLVARGLSSKQIAAQLVITPKTARNHIEHIYAKIGATSRVTASMFAVQNGLLPEPPSVALDA